MGATKIQGAGDVIAKVTEVLGIEECVGCGNKRTLLNVWFPFHSPRPLTNEEKEIVKNNPTSEQLIEIYNNSFCTNIESQEENVIKAITKKLLKLSDYEN